MERGLAPAKPLSIVKVSPMKTVNFINKASGATLTVQVKSDTVEGGIKEVHSTLKTTVNDPSSWEIEDSKVSPVSVGSTEEKESAPKMTFIQRLSAGIEAFKSAF